MPNTGRIVIEENPYTTLFDHGRKQAAKLYNAGIDAMLAVPGVINRHRPPIL